MKKAKKLMLAKETLGSLHHSLHRVVGADTAALDWCMGSMLCQPAPCPTGMYASCVPFPPSGTCPETTPCGGAE
jgi:hypothetical protein